MRRPTVRISGRHRLQGILALALVTVGAETRVPDHAWNGAAHFVFAPLVPVAVLDVATSLNAYNLDGLRRPSDQVFSIRS